jgi:type I restriction enzyme S subunit
MSDAIGECLRFNEAESMGVGLVPQHWELARLDKYVRVLRNSISPKEMAGKQVYHYSIPEFQMSGMGVVEEGDSIDSNKFLVAGGEVLVSKLNPRKSAVILTEVQPIMAVCSTEFVVLLPESIDRNFLYYLHLSHFTRERICSRVQSATRSHQRANPDDISKLWHAVPPIEEQKSIAGYVRESTHTIDELVAKKRRLIDLLSEQRAALINQAVTKGLNPNVPMKDSGVEWIGMVPEYWGVRFLSKAVGKIRNGYVGPTRDILVDKGVRYLQSLHIKSGRILFDKKYFVRPTWSERHAETVLRKGDVLIVQTGSIGECAVVPEEFDGCNCHALIITRAKPEVASGEYLALLFQSHYVKSRFAELQTGALHPHLEIGIVRNIPLPLPPLKEQKTILGYVEDKLNRFHETIETTKQEIERLSEYRTALISAAVTGKMEIPQGVGEA